MTKRRWIVTAAVVGLLIVGVTGGTLMAQQGGSDDGDAAETKSFADRVAEILGLDTETVEDAFDQAKRGMFDERVRKKLDAAVEKGLIDQAKADEILEWLAERPDGVPSWLLRDGRGKDGVKKRGFGPYGFPGGRKGAIIEKFSFDIFGDDDRPESFPRGRFGKGGPEMWTFPLRGFSFEAAPEELAESLEQAVEEGAINPELAERILKWIGAPSNEDDTYGESPPAGRTKWVPQF